MHGHDVLRFVHVKDAGCFLLLREGKKGGGGVLEERRGRIVPLLLGDMSSVNRLNGSSFETGWAVLLRYVVGIHSLERS